MLNASMYRVKEVEILDAMCGTGKSHNLFKFIKQNSNERFIYVTPMLTEVESRAAKELAKLGDTQTDFIRPPAMDTRQKETTWLICWSRERTSFALIRSSSSFRGGE
jgi:hypothetical protein